MKRYMVHTFGCQMNVHDSRRIEEVLRESGYAWTDEAETADLMVINTCSVREKAEHKLMSFLGTLRPLKEKRPEVVFAVAGCVAQQEGERLLKKSDLVDLVVGPDNIPELPELVREVEGGGPPRARTVFDMDDPQFLAARARPEDREVTAFVTTMKGCDERCTYCIVPYTRGEERYRQADDIVREVQGAVAGGVREVTLLGQTVNSWFEPGVKPRSKAAPSRSQFADLLRRIAREAPGLLRLRYTSPHPRHLTDELIAVHAELELLPAHVHLPVQSGSDEMLRRMSRRYGRDEYIERARLLLRAREGMTMSTDIIVGFPGETDEDFEATLDLVRQVGFVSAFCFKYSPRPFTPALKLEDDVPEALKDERLQRLFETVATIQRAHLDGLVGSTEEVLVEGPSKGGLHRFSGRTGRNEIVHVDVAPELDPTGHLIRVEVEEAYRHSLRGRMISEPEPTMKPAPKGRRRLEILNGAST